MPDSSETICIKAAITGLLCGQNEVEAKKIGDAFASLCRTGSDILSTHKDVTVLTLAAGVLLSATSNLLRTKIPNCPPELTEQELAHHILDSSEFFSRFLLARTKEDGVEAAVAAAEKTFASIQEKLRKEGKL